MWFLINKCLTKLTCNVCENFSIAHQELDENNLYSHFKALNVISLYLLV